ncbi:transporter suffix domain-containing protein [Chamaesiphon sp. VAR_48_metabat_403]|uniref:transporter suffix domain-containing protein n=1 Tax=Chamaesiphon sp. VAR_48_metabat_403 TaxID=2964700 RepID=UPI00286E5752|nr:transporter suffix domain-containing protein [Chamaesiphon sp. VAR_48_metabat_403]
MRSKIYVQIGLSLIVISCLLWAAILAVPILPLSIASKATTATILVIISEVLFWVGILLTGKEFAHRFRRQLYPYYWWQRFTHRK